MQSKKKKKSKKTSSKDMLISAMLNGLIQLIIGIILLLIDKD